MATIEFKGKQHIYAHHLTVPYRPLKPVGGLSLGSTSVDDNLIIHGDNLHALKALFPRYAGRVNCVYIDPPYNTGNEGWVYNDKVNSPIMQAWLKKNSPIDGEDLERHDKWLCMMWPRLHLLKELLAQDGVIFISIDDNEQHHLRMMMDEIFGAQNFFSRIVWESRSKPTNVGRARFNIRSNTESILVYGRQTMTTHQGFRLYPTTKIMYPKRDSKGKYRLREFQRRRNIGSWQRDTMVYSMKGISPGDGYRWQVSKSKYQGLEKDKLIVTSGEKVFEKIYENTEENSFSFEPFWELISKDIGTAEKGKAELNAILGINHGLETVKPTDLIKKIIYHSTATDGIILDSFAGSGTTAQAVLALNKEDNGKRKFILIECEDHAKKITQKRVRRVIRGVSKAQDDRLRKGFGGSFTFCTLGKPLDVDSMLEGESLPDWSTLAAWLLHTASGISAGSTILKPKNKDGLFYKDGQASYYLIYKPDLTWLRSNEAMLNDVKVKRIKAANKRQGKKAIIFGPGKFISQRDLTKDNISFCQLPYEIHRSG